jgi:hypothetical protein
LLPTGGSSPRDTAAVASSSDACRTVSLRPASGSGQAFGGQGTEHALRILPALPFLLVVDGETMGLVD